ncbi:hypothetical protein E2C01_022592 [Portunus trituberculatus]|uniref:Uncharacterized protein n=1 Tax=Portunus trituberculatus TaxID=210409 RepID=A0A5B7E8B8_PORTR|nr:hypothetical protein [Portunus trituberculatus]
MVTGQGNLAVGYERAGSFLGSQRLSDVTQQATPGAWRLQPPGERQFLRADGISYGSLNFSTSDKMRRR